MARILDMADGSVHRWHVDQIHYHVSDTIVNAYIIPFTKPADAGIEVRNRSVYRPSEHPETTSTPDIIRVVVGVVTDHELVICFFCLQFAVRYELMTWDCKDAQFPLLFWLALL